MLWESVITRLKIIFQVFLISTSEWRESGDHLVKYSTKTPDINLAAVHLASEDLWCHVKRSSTHCLREIGVLELLGESEICNYYVYLSNDWDGLFVFLIFMTTMQYKIAGGILEVDKYIR